MTDSFPEREKFNIKATGKEKIKKIKNRKQEKKELTFKTADFGNQYIANN